MEQILNYVKPELVVVAIVLYFVGVGLKNTETVADKYIPATVTQERLFSVVVTQKSRTRSTLRLPENQMSRSHRKFLPVNGATEMTERIVFQLPDMTTIQFRIL